MVLCSLRKYNVQGILAHWVSFHYRLTKRVVFLKQSPSSTSYLLTFIIPEVRWKRERVTQQARFRDGLPASKFLKSLQLSPVLVLELATSYLTFPRYPSLVLDPLIRPKLVVPPRELPAFGLPPLSGVAALSAGPRPDRGEPP